MKESTDLEVLAMQLKSGEYDGTCIMRAWIAIERLIELEDLPLQAELDAANSHMSYVQAKLQAASSATSDIAVAVLIEEALEIEAAQSLNDVRAKAVMDMLDNVALYNDRSYVLTLDVQDYATQVKEGKK